MRPILAAATLSIATAVPAAATPVAFQNAGFEDGLEGWTAGGAVELLSGIASQPHGGSASAAVRCSAFAGDTLDDPRCQLSQTLQLAAGQAYDFSVWIKGGVSNAEYQFSLGGTVLLAHQFGDTDTPSPDTTWRQLTFTGTAQQSSSLFVASGLTFLSSGVSFDDFSVTEHQEPSDVPEPAMLGLFGLGALGLGLARRRKAA